MMYKDCYDLPLNVFIDCIIDKDYSGISINGKHNAEELQERWSVIYEQYSELSGNGQYTSYVMKLKDYTRTLYRAQILLGALAVLGVKYDSEMIDALKDAGFTVDLDITKPLDYVKGLNDLAAQLPSMNVRIKRIEAELEGIRKSMSGHEPTRADFVKSIAGISKFMGFRVDPKQTTVAEFVTYQNDMIELSKKMAFKQQQR